MDSGNQRIDDVIDNAVITYYPEYAEAANISWLIRDLVMGTSDYLSTYAEQSRSSFRWKEAITLELYESAITDVDELSGLANLIRCSINSATDKAMAIVMSDFSEDLKAYSQCMGLLNKFLSSDPKSLAQKIE